VTLQSVRLTCWSRGRRRPRDILRKLAARREFVRLARYHGMGFVTPACRWSIPTGFPVFPSQTRRAWFKTPVDPYSEFRPSLEFSPAQPSRPSNREDSTTRPLSWALSPYSTCSQRGPPDAGFACPLRSAPRVWSPSRRFAPPRASPVLFRTGSAPGISPSELTPPARYPSRFRPEAPTYRFSRRCSQPPKRWTGPSSRGSWVLTLAGVL
jgi:hypothetical protein